MSGKPRTVEEWSRAIGRFFFRPERAGELVYLSTDEQTLAEIGGFTEPQEAANSLVRAVRLEVSIKGWGRLGLLRPTNPGGRDFRPGCLALLAFQVLVAFKMVRDADMNDTNYWGRAKLLLDDKSSSKMPKGLDAATHQAMWRGCLEKWANSSDYWGGELGIVSLPQALKGCHHIALPLSQSLLRLEDQMRMRSFFWDYDYHPGEAVESDRIWNVVRETLGDHRYFAPYAGRVLSDENRRRAALGQICNWLQNWDGRADDRVQAPNLRVWARLRRPPRFRFESGILDRSLAEQAFEQVDLLEILERKSKAGFVRSFHTDLRLLGWDDSLNCYCETRYLLPGQAALLFGRQSHIANLEGCRAGVMSDWEDLTHYFDLGGIWSAVRVEVAERPSPNAAWADYIEQKGIHVNCVGGLKLDRFTWMEGAGPTLRFHGDTPEAVWVDSLRVPLVDGLLTAPILDQKGHHVIHIPGRPSFRKTIEVASPRLGGYSDEPAAWNLDGKNWAYYGGDVSNKRVLTLLGLVLKGALSVFEAVVEQPPTVAVPSHFKRPDSAEAGAREGSIESILLKLLVTQKTRAQILTADEWDFAARSQHPVVMALYRSLCVTRPELDAVLRRG